MVQLHITLSMVHMEEIKGWVKMWAQPQLTAWLGNGDEHSVLAKHRSVIPEADAGLQGMELVTHLKDDMSWGVEAAGGAASQQEHFQLHHWQVIPGAASFTNNLCCLCPEEYGQCGIMSRSSRDGSMPPVGNRYQLISLRLFGARQAVALGTPGDVFSSS